MERHQCSCIPSLTTVLSGLTKGWDRVVYVVCHSPGDMRHLRRRTATAPLFRPTYIPQSAMCPTERGRRLTHPYGTIIKESRGFLSSKMRFLCRGCGAVLNAQTTALPYTWTPPKHWPISNCCQLTTNWRRLTGILPPKTKSYP